MDLTQAFTLDEARLSGGAPITIGDATFNVRRYNNPDFAAGLLELHRLLKPTGGRGMEVDALDDRLVNLIARTIVVGWQNVQLDGKELVYSVANCVLVLNTFQALREMLILESQNLENFRAEVLAEEGKSSAPDSSGS